MSTINLTLTAAAVVNARRAAVAAEKALKEAQDAFLTAAADADVEYVELDADGLRVAVEHRPRRTINLDVLKEHLPLAVVAEVIKEGVDTKAFDAAVELGAIAAPVADKAITVKTSTQVRVYGDAVVGER
jgi:hypothetical protein